MLSTVFITFSVGIDYCSADRTSYVCLAALHAGLLLHLTIF
jgi:hypothetical protein